MYKHFFIIGAQRSGTTYLYRILDEHPEIRMARPVKPEPKVFLSANYSERNFSIQSYYDKYFGDMRFNYVCGEKSTSYYEDEDSAQHIHKHFRDASIIFILRNPVERALSNYWFSLENGLETRTLEEVFIDKMPPPGLKTRISVDPFNYLGRSIYSTSIRRFLQFFPKEKFLILVMENFISNLESIQRLYYDLGVDSSFIPSGIDSRINQSKSRRGDESVAKVKQILNRYFADEIEKLENNFDLTLSVW